MTPTPDDAARRPRGWLPAAAWLALALAFMQMLSVMGGLAFPGPDLLWWLLFAAGTAGLGAWQQPPVVAATWIVGALAVAWYAANGSTGASWVILLLVFANLILADGALSSGRARISRWCVHGAMAACASGLAVAIAQVESQFADEEFFATLQVGVLALLWLMQLNASQALRTFARPWLGEAWRPKPLWVLGLLAASVLATIAATVVAYQGSFYSANVGQYPAGVSAGQPFVCAQVPSDGAGYRADEVDQRFLTRLRNQPVKAAPEYALLALATGESRWSDAFRNALLGEATSDAFSGPANSVKSTQYEAALRVYFYARVREAQPALFGADETALIGQWFADINRRALTVEWVDWMYALAFSKWPEGPYENQENGAGLLAALEWSHLADPALSPANRDYLSRNRRGWEQRFRNTDDAIIYQPEWIANAYLQSLYWGQANARNQRLSFDWLMLQWLPDGSAMGYNYPSAFSPAASELLAASLLGDAQHLWLAGRVLDDLDAANGNVGALPGIERAPQGAGVTPSTGSCLMYGDSGLPNQLGPLAPDKIVFRDGWAADSAYLLLNLRFTGWHRYKATNTVTLLYQEGALVSDDTGGSPSTWLPKGRSLFRDKRIPREDLSGVLVQRSGFGAVVGSLTGLGGFWAQDPPHYATVEQFTQGTAFDTSSTLIGDWHGWQQRRTVRFYHAGPIVVVDDAVGPAGSQAALVWHVAGVDPGREGRFTLREGTSPAEMVLLPRSAGQVSANANLGASLQTVSYQPSDTGRLRAVTVFLTGDWVGADATVQESAGGGVLKITRAGAALEVSLPPGLVQADAGQ
jgi:hypothetical protein